MTDCSWFACVLSLVVCFRVSTVDACLNGCNGHGVCDRNDACQCDERFQGHDCSERQCPYGLAFNSLPELGVELSVPNYPKGRHPYLQCSGKGLCNLATGQCKCFKGFTGRACSRMVCPNNCNGHGFCAVNDDVVEAYMQQQTNRLEKQYWDGQKSVQCLCDAGWNGADCSRRLCPMGKVSTTSCGLAGSLDVQLVTIARQPVHLGTVKDIEQYFTLSFTDEFNHKLTTKPISYYATSSEVQDALQALPNFAVPSVFVQDMYPFNDYKTKGIFDTIQGSGSQLEGQDLIRAVKCERWYHDNFQSTTCTTSTDCETKFGMTGLSIFCDNELNICIETEPNCAFIDGRTEFESPLFCAQGFEPDGIYARNVFSRAWGRRLTAHDRICHLGGFLPTNQKYRIPCVTSADCVKCSDATQVRAGVCASDGYCASNPELALLRSESATSPCNVRTFVLKFDNPKNSGIQNLVTCGMYGSADTNAPGASPKYESQGILSCHVKRIGLPEWTKDVRTGTNTGVANDLCFEQAADLSVIPTFAKPGECGGVAFDLDSTDKNNLILVLEDQSVSYTVVEKLLFSGLLYVKKILFTHEDVDELGKHSYLIVLPCAGAKRGKCDEETGSCQCATGYTGEACQYKINFS